jgi:hypothetical protein
MATRPVHRGPRTASLFFPLLVIVVGSVFLLNNLGVLPWLIWEALGKLWPVILIFFGIELLVGWDSPALSMLIGIIVLVTTVMVAAVMAFTGAGLARVPFQQQSVTVPLGQAMSGNVTLIFPVGTVRLGALPSSSADLIQAKATLPASLTLSQQVSNHGTEEQATVMVRGSMRQFWPFGSTRGQPGMNLSVLLAPDVPLTLKSELGAGQSLLDLSSLQIQQLTLAAGAGQTTIYFPSTGQTQAEVEAGAGQLILVIPPEVGATIHTKGGFINVHVPADRFQATDDGYRSLNSSTAPSHLDLTLHLGVGQVDVR